MPYRAFAVIVSSLLVGSALALAPVAAAQRAASAPTFDRVVANGVTLEYTQRGVGEAVVLVHAGIFADWFAPLLQDSALTRQYRVISYHRVGYAGSDHVAGPLSITQQAAQLRALMERLGIRRAHIVGHSSGGIVALQLALETPAVVQSLALLEPALPVAQSSGAQPAGSSSGMTEIMSRLRAGDRAGAVDGFMRLVAGPAYRPDLDGALPGAFQQGMTDAETFFDQELPAIRAWTFGAAEASRLTMPVLAVIGEKSPDVSPVWPERQRLLVSWLPDVEPFVLPGATHLLQLQRPHEMASALGAFFARHPCAACR